MRADSADDCGAAGSGRRRALHAAFTVSPPRLIPPGVDEDPGQPRFFFGDPTGIEMRAWAAFEEGVLKQVLGVGRGGGQAAG